MIAQRLRRTTCLAVLLLASACTDLSAVQGFAKLSADTADYKQLASDYSAYPDRLAQYGRDANWERTQRAAQAPRLLALQDSLTIYMASLGTLAADGLVSFDTNPLTKAASAAGAIKAADASDIAAIGNVLLNAAVGAWRQHEVERVVAEANPHVAAICGSLHEIVIAIAADDLQEIGTIDAFYDDIERGSRDKAGLRAVGEWHDRHVLDVQARKTAQQAYLQAIDAIKAGHQRLYDLRHDLSARETIRQINLISGDLRTIAKMIKL